MNYINTVMGIFRVVYHLPQNSVNFSLNVNGTGNTILTGDKWNILKGSPKFPTEISEWQMCFAIFHQFQAEVILRSCS